jgi:hypothetical protein
MVPQYFEFNVSHSSIIDFQPFQHDLDSGEYYGMFLIYAFKFYLKDLFSELDEPPLKSHTFMGDFTIDDTCNVDL